MIRAAACGALACLLASGADAQAPGFEALAAREIYQAVQVKPPLSLMARGEGGFAFYGTAFNQLEEVRCERSASFGFVALANEAGGIIVGLCVRELKRVRGLALAAKGSLDGLLGALSKSGAKLDAAALQKFGWVYRQRETPGGEAFTFPVLMVGHGILGPDTVVLFPRTGNRVVIVQAESRRMCTDFKQRLQTPLCSDPDGSLLEIARRIAALP